MNKKKKWIVVGACVLVLGTVAIVAASVMGFGYSSLFWATGGCLSVSFDKMAMNSVDKVLVDFGEKEVEITDPNFVKLLVDETMAATNVHVGCPEDRRIDLYSGDKLIRSMGWSTCCDTVHVYGAGDAHWTVSIEGAEADGFIYLPDSLVDRLNELLGE